MRRTVSLPAEEGRRCGAPTRRLPTDTRGDVLIMITVSEPETALSAGSGAEKAIMKVGATRPRR
jgi:hypothetical protein